MSVWRRLAGHSLIYGLVGMAGSLASIALTPLYARYLGPADYGQLETLLALVQVVTIVAAFGAGSAALGLIIRPEGEPEGIAGSAMAVVGIVGAICLAAGLLAAPLVAGWLSMPVAWVRLVVLCGYVGALAQIPYAIWRARGQVWILSAFTLVQVLATLGLNIVQVAWWGHGAEGILQTLLVVQGSALVAGGIVLRRELFAGCHWVSMRAVLSYGYTHTCNSLANWVVQLSDRFLLMAAVAAAEVGHYTLGNKISFIGQLLLATPLAMAWPSFLQQMGRDETVARSFGRLFAGITAYGCGLFLLVSLFAREWILFFGGAGYLDALPLVPVLAAAVLVNAVMPLLLAGLGLSMNFRLYPAVTAVGSATNLLLNLWWIPIWGAPGSAWATLVAYLAAAWTGRMVSERVRPLPIDWRPIIVCLSLAGSLFLVGAAASLPWRLACLLCYPAGLLGWYGYQRRTRQQPQSV
jgi:O-antigen/teichoic acid export membrane protein